MKRISTLLEMYKQFALQTYLYLTETFELNGAKKSRYSFLSLVSS